MSDIQRLLVVAFSLLSFFTSVYGFYQCKHKKNAYGATYPLFILSTYVWGDAFIFGLFFAFSGIVTLFLNDWIMFLLIISIFWLVRSVGETIYWFLEQFATKHRNPYERLPFYKFFHNDSIWFIFQICNQCITVITIITTVYLFHIWLSLH